MMDYIAAALRRWVTVPGASSGQMDRTTEIIVVLVLFTLLFFLVRIPLFSLGWDGNDGSGHDADIFVHQPSKPNYLLFARFGGKEVYESAWGHPGPPYAMFGALGKITGFLVNYERLSNGAIIALLKTVASLFQLAIWYPLLVLIARCGGMNSSGPVRFSNYFGVGALALSPIAIQSSNEFQVDSTFGVIIAGAYALALIAAERSAQRPMLGGGLIVLAAAFIGLGKNEWTLMLLLSCAAMMVLLPLGSHLGYCGAEFRKLAVFCLSATLGGLAVGNLASYLFEPTLYTSGWHLLFSMAGKASAFGAGGWARLTRVTAERLPFIQVHLVLMAYILWRLVAERDRLSAPLVLASIYGAGLFAAFFLSTWGPFPRYFAPAFSVLCVVAGWLYANDTSPSRIVSVASFLVCGWIAVTGVQLAYGKELAERSVFGKRDISAMVRPGCAVLIQVDDVYRRKDVDFVHSGWGYEGAVEGAKRYGGVVCPLAPARP